MDDEVKGIPRRYTEDEWRELTKKKAKGIHPIVKQLALLVSVMVGVALAVSALSSEDGFDISGKVIGDPNFVLEVYDEDSSSWVPAEGYIFEDINACPNQWVGYEIKIRWHDNSADTIATVVRAEIRNPQNIEEYLLKVPNEGWFEGYSINENEECVLRIEIKPPSDAIINENISGHLYILFETS